MTFQFDVFPVVGPDDNPRANAKVFQLLRAVRETGSLHRAAKQVGLSYRHAWGVMRGWEDMLGRTLLDMERGRGASLTLFGERMLRAELRLHEQIDPLLRQAMGQFLSELEDASQSQSRIRFSGSHDPAVEALAQTFTRQADGAQLDAVFCSAVEGLICLQEKQCEVAGFYVAPQQGSGSIAHQTLRKWLRPTAVRLIALADREQGLMMSAQWAGRVQSLTDLARTRARFVNRQRSSGTRLLFDQLLVAEGLYPDQINGYDEQEFSSDKIAVAVQEGRADVGFGLRPGAEAHGLHFVPLTRETYYLAVRRNDALAPWVRELAERIGSSAFREGLSHLAGYRAPEHIALLSAEQALPWHADESRAAMR
ncbi:substrate-binding domain-containing protein [Ralstonia solanacearum]|uniref:substrate-binding domain-containing protein n=1 Tax=Ralstonia solanacearum TaxID=305 RepID=UPI000BE78514|nr:substrate-binding domain-containing protein [Ralstonia solanacearum]ATJ86914.1 LysR family transcriptional regulator [Ralstonia solanacearum]